MDVLSVGVDTEHIAREESPSMKDIVNQVLNTNLETNITSVDEDMEEETEGEDVDLVSRSNLQRANNIEIYRKRWYILFVFSFFTLIQGEVGNTWTPIADSAQFIFGWSDHTIALICNLVLIAYVVAIPFSTWLMDTKGLRISCLVAAFMMSLGTGIRCITFSTTLDTWLVSTGQILIGFSGPVAVTGAPLLSSKWFPANQRTTCTAIAVIMNNIGMAMSFIAGPVLVPGVSAEINPLPKGQQYQQIKADVLKYMYITFGSCSFVFLLILVYFPAEPPIPPSASSGIERSNYKEGIKMIMKNFNFWILALAYSIPNGAGTGWVSVIDLILADVGVSQSTAGWIGFTAAIVSSVGAIILACLADIFKGRIKQFLIILYSITALTFILFIFIYYKVVISMPLLYISLIIAAFGALANAPLFYSMASEVTFPAGEAVTNGAFTILFKLFSITFLLVLSMPGVSTSWMNWCFTVSIVVSLPVLLLFKEQYRRLNMDIPDS